MRLIMYGKEIRYLRKSRNKTQAEVSKGTGLPQATISWIETNRGVANIQQCVILADYYGISIDELIGREIPSEK